MIDEQKILKDLKKRKRGALEKAIELYTPYINVISYNIIGNVMSKEDIEEVIADVFISLWKHADTLDNDKGSIRSYLGATARNCAKNKLREVYVHTELNETFMDNTSIETDFEKNEESGLLLSAISELGEPDSEIFMRYYYYDEKIKTISQITGLCLSTVKTKLLRGRVKLKEILKQKKEGKL